MYLRARRHMWSIDDDPDKDISKRVESLFPEVEGMELREVSFEAAYWRKANAIHGWFVRNVQNGKDDCGTYHVTVDKLRQLLDEVNRVLEDPNQASELLPPQSGFFFGSSETDEWYFADLDHTRVCLERAIRLAERDRHFDFEYHSSW